MSIAYVDLAEGELFHWKYIKRAKLSNGKWRYYYDDSNLTMQKREIEQAESKVLQNRSNMVNAQKTYGDAQTAKLVASNRYNNLANNDKAKYSEVKAAKDAYNVAAHKNKTAKIHALSVTNKYNASVKLAEKLVKSYERKKIVSFPRRAISKGVVAAANWINGNRSGKTRKP